MDDTIQQLVAVAIVAVLYFLPSLTAKGHPHRPSIFVINLSFGWTGIGWVLALAWALIPITHANHR